jgi:hypothetical protein
LLQSGLHRAADLGGLHRIFGFDPGLEGRIADHGRCGGRRLLLDDCAFLATGANPKEKSYGKDYRLRDRSWRARDFGAGSRRILDRPGFVRTVIIAQRFREHLVLPTRVSVARNPWRLNKTRFEAV